MENKQQLERLYEINYNGAMNYVKQGNLADAENSLKRALETVIKLMKMSYGKEQENYKARADKLAGLLKTVREKLTKPPVTVGGDPRSNPSSPNSTEVSEDGINYVINGVNVKDFLTNESNDPVTFNDVKGMESEKALIEREFFLTKEQREFNEYLGKKPKTFILLYGVPGTGKTFFAKAISDELKRRSGDNVPFFSVVGSQLSDCKVGATEKNIQAVFEFCKQFEHCVLFIDEFDTIAPDRKQATGDPTAASRVTVLLQMMDGFASAKGTLVIAATNCPYNLDGAVLSRANTRIEIPLPSYDVIYAVIKGKIGDKLADDVDLSKLASKLEKCGYSNRDIKNFIGNMVDSLSDEFAKAQRSGQIMDFRSFKYTNAMIEKAFAEIVPTTKQSDIQRIRLFNEKGE